MLQLWFSRVDNGWRHRLRHVTRATLCRTAPCILAMFDRKEVACADRDETGKLSATWITARAADRQATDGARLGVAAAGA
jgi:hypothetical protein